MPEVRRRERERIVREALARDSAVRQAYLDEACSGDAELRREVESLLASRRMELEGFLESPPWTCEAPTLAVGARLGPYEVVGPPLRGGMGSVYRARDTRLGRSVALKVLGGSAGMTPAAHDRFRREAHAIAALDHPNICALFDVGSAQQGGPGGVVVDYFVMEFLHGLTLHERLAIGDGRAPAPLSIDEALTYGIQIADALATAHEAGFVHRDLKPSNIMLVPSGPGRDSTTQAKLLDFGLAKRVPVSGLESQSTVSAELATNPGTVLGTLGYLSPEQARGEEVGAGSDLFAFGTVLFEMLTGRRAFVRGSAAETLARVLTDDPPRPSTLNPAVPASFDAIVEKALEKDRELRYQSAAEIRADLRRAQRERLGHAPVPPSGAARIEPAVARRQWRRWTVPAAATLTVCGAIAVALRMSDDSIPDFDPSLLTPGRGVESEPAFGPDPMYVAYTAENDGNRDVFVLDRRSGIPRNLTAHQAADYHPSWLRDGSEVLFVSDRSGEPAIWRTPSNGGTALPVAANADDVAVSPDGSRLAFTRRVEAFGRIFVADIARPTEAKQLTFVSDGPYSHRRPAWSPDGSSIAYNAHGETWIVSSSGGPGRRLAVNEDFEANPVWSSDGRALYYSSNRGGGQAIWRAWVRPSLFERLAFWRPAGPERVSRASGFEQQPALSAGGRLMAFSVLRDDAQIALRDLQSGKETLWGTQQPESFPALAPDGSRLFFVSRAASQFSQLWLLNLHAGRPVGLPSRLTDHDGYVSHPACSSDGRWVAYWVGKQRDSRIWVVSASGGAPIQVTGGPTDVLPDWSPGSDQVVYIVQAQGKGDIWRVPVWEGKPSGLPVQVTKGPADDDAPAWSRDGSLIAFTRLSSVVPGRSDVWTVRPDGSGEEQVTNSVWAMRLAWDPIVPDALLVVGRWDSKAPGIELRRIPRRPYDRPPPFQPVRFDADDLIDFSVSLDGKLLVLARSATDSRLGLWTAKGRGRF